jgi:hypothetical protein
VLRESARARRGDIVPFIKSDMPVQAKGSIIEIVGGPSVATGAEDGVYALLKPFHDGPNAIVRPGERPRESEVRPSATHRSTERECLNILVGLLPRRRHSNPHPARCDRRRRASARPSRSPAGDQAVGLFCSEVTSSVGPYLVLEAADCRAG